MDFEGYLVLNSIIGLATLLWLAYGPWQRLVVDVARQRLFEIRDELFDLAVDGEIDFKSPQYVETRRRINGLIKYIHKLTVFRFIMLEITMRKMAPPTREADDSADSAANAKIEGMLNRCSRILLVQFWVRSPLLVISSIFLPVALFAAMLSGSFRSFVFNWLARAKEEINQDAAATQVNDAKQMPRYQPA